MLYIIKIVLTNNHQKAYRREQIVDVRVVNDKGTSMTFCQLESRNGDFFVNLTTKRVHLFVEKDCPLAWIANSRKFKTCSSTAGLLRTVCLSESRSVERVR